METDLPVEPEIETKDSDAEKKEQINIGDGISTQEAQDINENFSQNPKETVKNLQNTLTGLEESKKKEIASQILGGIEKGYQQIESREDIESLLTLLSNLSTLDPKIQQTKEGETNPYNTIKTALEEKKQAIDDKQIQEKKENQEKEQGLISLQNILNAPNNSPEELFQNGTKIFEKDRLAYDALFENRENLQTNENLRKIILTYALGGVDIEKKVQYKTGDKVEEIAMYEVPTSIDLTRFTTQDTKYETGTRIIQIPAEKITINTVENNQLVQKPGTSGKKNEIFFGTTDQLHTARAQKTIQDNKIDELVTETKPNDIANIIDNLDEKGSYVAFKAFLDKADPKYLQKNFRDILPAIQTENLKYEGSNEKINGYYRIIAEKVIDLAQKGDKDTLSTYLLFISQNPAYLGVEQKDRINNWQIIAKRGDSKILKSTGNDELKALFLKTKLQLDPNGTKKEITEQIGDAIDQFFDSYGTIIAQVVDFFGGKGAFMKYLPETLQEKFKEKFKEKFQMNEKQLANFNHIDGQLKSKITNTTEHTSAKHAIDIFKEDNEDKRKINTNLAEEANFKKLSPNLIGNIIKEYNKKEGKEKPITISDFITVDGKGKAESIKSGNLEDRKIIITKLLKRDSSLRTNIQKTHDQIIKNTNYNVGTKEETNRKNINGSDTNKGINTFHDISTYIAAYVTTGGEPPFHHIIAENDAIRTSVNNPNNTEEETKKQEVNTQETEEVVTEGTKEEATDATPAVVAQSEKTTNPTEKTEENTPEEVAKTDENATEQAQETTTEEETPETESAETK